MELFRLIIKRIKDLLLFSGLITGEEYLIVYDPVTDTSYKVKVSSIRGGQSTLEKWSPDAEYDEGKILEWNLKIWQSLTDNNQGNIPTEGAFWTEVSRSEGGNCGYYAPGVFTNDPTIVLHSGSLYWLDNTVVTLPFNSTDFAAELAANKWKSITGSGGLTPEQEEVLDDAEAHIDGADEVKHGASQISTVGGGTVQSELNSFNHYPFAFSGIESFKILFGKALTFTGVDKAASIADLRVGKNGATPTTMTFPYPILVTDVLEFAATYDRYSDSYFTLKT